MEKKKSFRSRMWQNTLAMVFVALILAIAFLPSILLLTVFTDANIAWHTLDVASWAFVISAMQAFDKEMDIQKEKRMKIIREKHDKLMKDAEILDNQKQQLKDRFKDLLTKPNQ